MAGRTNGSGPVAVTGIDIITSLGSGREENWRKLSAGASGIHPIVRFSTKGLRTTIGGSVDFVGSESMSASARSLAMARQVARSAIGQSGIAEPGHFPGELILAAPPLEHEWQHRFLVARRLQDRVRSYRNLVQAATQDCGELHADFLNGTMADQLAEELGTTGSPITLSTACASGATAIQFGVEAIRRGSCGAALAIGTDGSMHVEALIRFSLLSALSTANDPPEKAAKPFSRNRDGFVMAEGAAALVLEDADRALARGARILALVRGCGEAADDFHRTRSNPDGGAIIRCMTNAILDAGIEPEDIGYINAHGTGTPENDKMECLGMRKVFGARAERTPISSNKSMIGHTLTAAGAVEAAFSIMTLERQVLPPTINYDIPDPLIPLDVVPNRARAASLRFVLSNSFGFGGQNVSLVFAHPDA